ncbi:fimbrial biogenesis chaperone [Montanilutibacter psychrotolerans]|uniref:Molecular chaperone n=1 Tax=Montanilutibacter psychrotolerans TaxID=1327343 RepID=A0A3M8T2D0_9GAMM|nr:molecular chaperone [Lysobacter psychrotolerans]RNF84912.1 molecular chaperone [Lysobacter psychrotolerans]
MPTRPSSGAPLVVFALATLAWLAMGHDSRAASLQVAPTTITLQARQAAEGLTLSNTGAQTLHAQLRVFRWTQHDGVDRLDATGDVVLSPPMLELAPGARQLVRIVRTGPAPVDREASYRVIVDELPIDAHDASRSGLRLALRYSIPVFLMPVNRPQSDVSRPDASQAQLSATLHARLGGAHPTRFIEIDNTGDAHAQIADLAFVGDDGQRVAVAPGLSGYVLPGQRMRWNLPVTLDLERDAGRDGAFKARINGEPGERTLVLDATAR